VIQGPDCDTLLDHPERIYQPLADRVAEVQPRKYRGLVGEYPGEARLSAGEVGKYIGDVAP